MLPSYKFYLCLSLVYKMDFTPPVKEKEDEAHQAKVRIVTGFSDNHFGPGMLLLRSTEPFNISVIVYNLGLNPSNNQSLTKYASQQHHVQLRPFNFHKYPKYVSDLHQYRWKPIIVHECMQEFSNILWLDAGMSLFGNFSAGVREVVHHAQSHSGVFALYFTDHSIFAATHPSMYKYLPLNESLAKRIPMLAGGEVFVHRNTQSERLTGKWRECALEEGCMAPKGHRLSCRFQKDRWNYYADCNRYDQAALALILAHEYEDMNQYSIPDFVSFVKYRTE